MDREFLEEIIFGLADIVCENHRLRQELKEAKEYEKKYNELLDSSVKNAKESHKALAEAIFAGAFAGGK